MALADRLTNPPAAGSAGLPCSIGALLEQLHGDELAALNAMLGSRAWTQGMVYDALTAEGYTVGRQSINRHRGGKCRCVSDVAA